MDPGNRRPLDGHSVLHPCVWNCGQFRVGCGHTDRGPPASGVSGARAAFPLARPVLITSDSQWSFKNCPSSSLSCSGLRTGALQGFRACPPCAGNPCGGPSRSVTSLPDFSGYLQERYCSKGSNGFLGLGELSGLVLEGSTRYEAGEGLWGLFLGFVFVFFK